TQRVTDRDKPGVPMALSRRMRVLSMHLCSCPLLSGWLVRQRREVRGRTLLWSSWLSTCCVSVVFLVYLTRIAYLIPLCVCLSLPLCLSRWLPQSQDFASSESEIRVLQARQRGMAHLQSAFGISGKSLEDIGMGL